MTIRHLENYFAPRSVAVIGASPKTGSVGALVFDNLCATFKGDLHAVNPRHRHIHDQACLGQVDDLPSAPDLAVVCTPPKTVPRIIQELGEKGCKAVVVITGGMNGLVDAASETLTQQMLNAARPHNLRIIGPNCLGILVPGVGLNASFAHTHGLPGKLAFVSQSGALATAVLDWSRSRGIGFSAFVTIGDAADVDMGDLLDYFASDAGTSAILLYIESVKHARKFMSAARAAARGKPVIAVKSGRAQAAARAVVSHTGALAGSDAVVDTALRRAGILRVDTLQDLFAAAETLARAKPLAGDGLVIVTNGGGAGVLAIDALTQGGGEPAELSPPTLSRLDAVLPGTWSHANPIDIIGDAPTTRYVDALKAVRDAPEAGAVLLMHAPTGIVASLDIARACLPEIQASSRTVLTSWLGEDGVKAARDLFESEGVPGYATPEEAVRAFLQLRDYRQNQELLMQTPPPVRDVTVDDTEVARVIDHALREGRKVLTEIEAKSVLRAYGVPVVQTCIANDVEQAVVHADQIGYPVVLKILSPDITHKSDVGGVALDLTQASEVRQAATRMLAQVQERLPRARIKGFTVQSMVKRGSGAYSAHELILGCTDDAVFGPVLLFGQGGTGVEVVRDRAFALPPLNAVLARDLIGRTRVARLLAGYRDRPAIHEQALIDVILRLSRLLCEHHRIKELDINPLLADHTGVIALDARIHVESNARIRVAEDARAPTARLAILPYPDHLVATTRWLDRDLIVRPIRAEDEALNRTFLEQLSPEDVHLRFFHSLRSWTHHQLARFTQIDYDREMAFVATTAQAPIETLGVARAIANPDNTQAEFAIVVRSDLKGKGLGRLLMNRLIAYQRGRGTEDLVGDVLASNTSMLRLARELGFKVEGTRESEVLRLSLALAGA